MTGEGFELAFELDDDLLGVGDQRGVDHQPDPTVTSPR